ncbi:Hypothetical protein NHP190003_09780 [Helicobacter sp. NHP19-003]|uniref:Uncharacterized protein n=1 Tax=Helicobacter gastrocanis TaxID=2849641 RepID=A0ABM7SAQ0_9HELI|nr:hypothetical protein [Helicobacter sp. NHP19-003]BCZ17696.1 Hypothetical protein NHP190003_09780 [Helicobacter sp. NHP19-003]
MITLDVQANARLATSNANESTMIAKMQEHLYLFAQLIERAKAQAATLESMRNILEQSHTLEQAHIAPLEPMRAYLEQEIKQAKAQELELQERLKAYKQAQMAQMARLKHACPWLDFDTATLKSPNNTAQEILNKLKTHNPPLAPKPLSTLLCTKVQAKEAQAQHKERLKGMQEALLRGDFNHYEELQTKDFQELANFKESAPKPPTHALEKRLEELQVRFANNTLEKQINALNTNLAIELKDAKDPNARASAYATYNQKAQSLELKLLLELSRHLAFLNETMAMQAHALAKNTLLKAHTPLNPYGFPSP